jgi:hypothetical protein
MIQKVDGFIRVADSLRNLCSFALTGTEDLICLQLECAEVFFNRNSKQVRAALASMDNLQEPGQWPAGLHPGIEETNAMLRDTVVSAMDFQIKSFQLTHRVAGNMQKLLSSVIIEQLDALQPGDAGSGVGGKTIFLRQSAAA